MRTSTVSMLLAVLVGLATLSAPVAARYLPTKRGSDSDRLDRLAHLIKELLAESDAAPVDHAAYDQRVFYKREAREAREAHGAPLAQPAGVVPPAPAGLARAAPAAAHLQDI